MEFVEVDLTVIVRVNLLDNIHPDCLVIGGVFAQNLGNLSCLNRATAIFVEKRKGGTHVFLVKQLVLIDGGRAPLAEVYRTTFISVSVLKDFDGSFCDFLLTLVRVELHVTVDELMPLDEAIAIFIPLVERSSELLLLLFCGKVT